MKNGTSIENQMHGFFHLHERLKFLLIEGNNVYLFRRMAQYSTFSPISMVNSFRF